MSQPANDLLPPEDEDDAERLELDAKAARTDANAEKYRGRPDLLEIAFIVSLELGRLNRELVTAHREKRPKPERQALLEQELIKAREFAAILVAMREADETAIVFEGQMKVDEIDDAIRQLRVSRQYLLTVPPLDEKHEGWEKSEFAELWRLTPKAFI